MSVVELIEARKTCNACFAILPLSEFYRNGQGSQGQPRYYSECRECLGKRSRTAEWDLWTRVRKALGGLCVECGCDDQDVLIPIDRRLLGASGRQARMVVKSLSGLPWRAWMRDILKTPKENALLCANCHWKRRVIESHDGGRRLPNIR